MSAILGAPAAARAEAPQAVKAEGPLAAILEKIPVDGKAAAEQLGKDLVALGAKGIDDLVGLIVEPSKIDDSKARFAIHALAMYVSRPGAEAQRLMLCEALRRPLASAGPDSVKAFFIQQLRLMACPQAVAALKEVLLAEALCEDASHALVSIGGDEARAALREALPKAEGKCRLTILQNLGILRDAASAPAILKAAGDPDREVRLTALYALANIGDAAATETLLRAAGAASAYERAGATDSVLLLARRLAEAGKKKEAEHIYRTLWKTRDDPKDRHVRCAALKGLGAVVGAEAVGDLAEAMKSEDPQIRAAAAEAALEMPGEDVTAKWIDHMAGLSPEGKAGILALLEQRGGDAALGAVLGAMRDADAGVRLAAIDAAKSFPGSRAVPALVTFLASKEGKERDAARRTLARVPGDEASAAVASALPATAPEIRRDLLGVLAARGARQQADAVMAAVKDPDGGVRESALRALEVLGEEKHVAALVEIVVKSKEGGERGAAEKALGAVAARSNKDRAAGPILAAMGGADADARILLIRALAKAPTDKALDAVRAAMKDKDARMQDAAVRVLSEWPDAKVAEDLMAVARTAGSITHRVLALRGYVRLAGKTKASTEDVVGMYRKAMQAAARPEEKKLVLAGLAEVQSVEALGAAVEAVADEALREEAAAAVVRIAEKISKTHPADVEGALDKVVEAAKSDGVRKDAARILDVLRRDREYIKAWLVSGPYREKGKGMTELFEIPFAPEKDPKQAQWKPVGGMGWMVDLDRLVGGSDAAAYLRTAIWSPEDQEARLETGSDDGLKVWLNGEVVVSKNVPRGMTPGDDKTDVRVKKGWNTLLLKVTQGGGGWAACAKLVARDSGKALKGIRVDPRGE